MPRTFIRPRTVITLLTAACVIFLLQTAALLFFLDPPYDAAELTVVWATGFVGIVLVVIGATAAWDLLIRLRRSESHLLQTRQQLAALFDASPLAVMAGDVEGRALLWNRAAERLFGWTREEIIGRPIPGIPEEAGEAFRDMRKRVLAGEILTGVETTRCRKDGSEFQASVSAAGVRDAEGRTVMTIAMTEDITPRKLAEEERDRLEQQLRQAQKMEAVGRLAGGVAHDFNNLLTAIKGHTALALDLDSSRDDTREALEEIDRSADRAAGLTRQLLAFSRQQVVEPRPIDLNRIVRDMDPMLSRLLGERVRLRMDLEATLDSVLADPGQVEQVLMNLAVNARDALPIGGEITIRTSNAIIDSEMAGRFPYEVRPGDYALMAVTDNGMGMDEPTREQIFEPFFTTKPTGVGTGLGLSTVYGIVKQTGGYIWVDSEPDRGATFLVYWPVTDSRPAPRAEPVRPTTMVPERPQLRRTILVAEDEDGVRRLVRKVLERMGHRVLEAASGRDAEDVASAHQGEIHLFFTDIVMPDANGREVADRIRLLRPDIRVLFMSGYAEAIIAHHGLLEEGIQLLEKPFTPADMARKVQQVLAGSDG